MDTDLTLQLKTSSTSKGIEVLAITAGIGNGWEFSSAVLQASLPLWDKAECYADHNLDKHSVRDLGGILIDPVWDMEAAGIRATLTPTGPAAPVFVELALAAIDHPDLSVGLSADLLMRVDGRKVLQILKVKSLDAVTSPARGGKFVRVIQHSAEVNSEIPSAEPHKMATSTSPISGEYFMTETIFTTTPPNPELESSSKEADLNMQKLAASGAAVVSSLQNQQIQTQMEEANATSIKLQKGMCQTLLQAALVISRLPEAWQARIRKDYADQVFEPEALQKRIEDDRLLLSSTTAGNSIQGPSIQGVFNTQDYLEAAVDDLLGATRRADLAQVQTNHLSGIRELYMMLTGDYELHGGYRPERVQLATTTDFSGLVKNALNKLILERWEELGQAGYNWWENIVSVEHFDTLNDITSVLVGTVGSLPTVAEGGEYTELAVGDSPETGSFVKKGGYIPLTLELIDRDETRKLRAYPKELAFASLRTISGLVAAIFTANSGIGPTLADTGALFNNAAVTTKGGHANLLVTDLTNRAVWDATAMAMYDQPMLVRQDTGYYGTGAKLAVNPRYCLCSRHKWEDIRNLFVNAWDVADNKHMENLLKGEVIPLCVPEWTDDDNWAAVADPRIAPAIIVGERFGIRPEIFIANHETNPAVFMNDEHRLKIRHFVAVMVSDFRPLHKSNV